MLWWGYKHINGSIHPKRFWDKKDIQEAIYSDFVEEVVEPFEALNRNDAIKKISDHLNKKNYEHRH